MPKAYYWVHLKECNHGDPWPCRQPKGYISCGENGWTIALKEASGSFSIIGSDCPASRSDFDKVVKVKEVHP